MGRLKRLSVVIGIVLTCIYIGGCAWAQGNSIVWPGEPQVGQDKVWTIKFSDGVRGENLEEFIFVMDEESGESMNASVKIGKAANEVVVIPESPYPEGRYVLKITDQMESAKGEKLSNGVRLHFNVTESQDTGWEGGDAGLDFGLSGGRSAEQCYYSPVGAIGSVACSEYGDIFVKIWGNETYVGIVDLENGEIDRLEIPPINDPYLVEGPEDTVVVRDNEKAYLLHSDGRMQEWCAVPQALQSGMMLDLCEDGSLLFKSEDMTELYRLEKNGNYTKFNYEFEKIDDAACRSDGLIAVSDIGTGSICRIDKDGEAVMLNENLIYNDPLRVSFDRDGKLYARSVTTGFAQVDMEDGSLHEVGYNDNPWVCASNPSSFSFVSEGKAVFGDYANGNVLIWDFKDGSFEYPVLSRTNYNRALSLAPDGNMYLALSGYEGYLSSQVVELEGGGDYSVAVDAIEGRINDMEFDDEGGLYVLFGSRLSYYRSFSESPVSVDIPPDFAPMYLAVNPKNGNACISGFHSELLYEYDKCDFEGIHSLSFPKEPRTVGLAFDSGGDLLGFGSEWENNDSGPTVERWIVKFDLDEGTNETVYSFPRHGSCPMGNIDIDMNDNIWLTISPEQQIIKLSPEGGEEMVAENAPMDAEAIAAGGNGDVFINCNEGVYRIFGEGQNTK